MCNDILGEIRRRAARATIPALVAVAMLAAAGMALPEGFKSETIGTGLDLVAVKVAPDGRVFVTEKKGTIRVVKDDKVLPAPFVNISSKVDATREKGLLGIAIDPDYLANKFVYAFYVDKNNSCYILRWTADGDVAAAGSEKQIFDLGVSGNGDYHHGGDIAFGGDGMLYITRGNRQDENASKEQTGRMHFVDIADGTADDEIDEVKKGAHYGAYSAGTLGPIIKKGSGGSAIMGGLFYNKKKPADRLSFPAQYHGKYFWGQFGGNGIRILDHATKAVTSFDGAIPAPINFDIAADGSVYVVTRTTQVFDTKGQILKIRYPAGETPSRIEPGAIAARGVMKWDIRAGSGVEVELFGEGAQTLRLSDLQGKMFAELRVAGPGKVRISAIGSGSGGKASPSTCSTWRARARTMPPS